MILYAFVGSIITKRKAFVIILRVIFHKKADLGG